MHTRWNSFLRNTTLATVLLAGVYGLRAAAPLDTLESPWRWSLLFPSNPKRLTTILGVNYPEAVAPVVFIAELFLLGLVGTAAAHLVHRWATDAHHTGWHLGVAGALGIVGIHWIEWGIKFSGTTHTPTEPVVITGVSGLILLGLAGWLAGSGTRK
ncbi:hypothetical protein [Halosolutus halophilus]|uniref:hypothetical protein n=1 Tax=Halosolutus halophilus TaxID=1552990 RepID=UPI002234F37B|nr:hypothetical protein [Halosolutus halophilus]